jgi:hypothetical protein
MTSLRPIKKELSNYPGINPDTRARLVQTIRMSMVGQDKMHCMEEDSPKSLKSKRESYFVAYANVASDEVLQKKVPMKKKTGEKMMVPVINIVEKAIGGISVKKQERLENKFSAFNQLEQKRLPEVSLTQEQMQVKQKEKQSSRDFDLDDLEDYEIG